MSQNTPMPADGSTIMEFKKPSGDPLEVTINGKSASEWTLVPDQSSPTGVRWDPL